MPSRLEQKWGSKENWLRCLYVEANIICLFQQELVRLELGQLRWLDAVLKDALLAISVHAPQATTTSEAFEQAIELVRINIEQRIATVGADAELTRLLAATSDAHECDIIHEIFKDLSGKARSVYRKAPRRKMELRREWLNSHPIGSISPTKFHDPYHVSAVTEVQPDLNRSNVELRVHLDEFGVKSLLAIPAMLTHELVCHAYANETGTSDLKSIWAEGVMDWAAYFFSKRWSLRLKLPYPVTKRAGDDLWHHRMTAERYTGRAIADTLLEWFAADDAVRGATMAEQVTARYALEINIVEAPLCDKDKLASRIANISTDPALQGSLRAWLRGKLPASAMLLDM